MESGARQTGRVHEHELCPEFEHSARHHRPANHSWRALSTCSRTNYEKSDGQCHARLWLTQLYVCWRRIMSSHFSPATAHPLARCSTEVCWFALRPTTLQESTQQ